MRKAAPPRLTFPTYQHLLRALTDNALIVVRRVADELSPERKAFPPTMDLSTVARKFAIISGFVRRTVVVSRYIATLPVPTEEREHRLAAALDRVFSLYAARKMTTAEYNRALEAEIDGECEDVFEDDLLDGDNFDGEPSEYDPNADVPGRPPASLVAELCRDFGMIAHSVPTEWLTSVPTELRVLCARAAAAAIRPSTSPVHAGQNLRH